MYEGVERRRSKEVVNSVDVTSPPIITIASGRSISIRAEDRYAPRSEQADQTNEGGDVPATPIAMRSVRVARS